MLPKSCAAPANVVSSPDALGLLADLYCARCAPSVAGQTPATKVDGASANWDARTDFALCIDYRFSVGGCGGCCLACVGARTGLRRIGFGGAWALADLDRRNCRRCDFGRFAVAEFTAYGAIFGEGAGVHASTRRADSAAIAAGAGSLPGASGDGGRLRGIPVSRICHGSLNPRGTSRLERGATIFYSLWEIQWRRWHWPANRNPREVSIVPRRLGKPLGLLRWLSFQPLPFDLQLR